MVDQYYFETAKTQRRDHPGRERARLERLRARDALRKEREIEINRVTAARLQHMITELERQVVSLNGSIEAALDGAQSRDPSNFAYPIAARALGSRRDNMRSTIDILTKQLAQVNAANPSSSMAQA